LENKNPHISGDKFGGIPSIKTPSVKEVTDSVERHNLQKEQARISQQNCRNRKLRSTKNLT
jgi:hypothetical protein